MISAEVDLPPLLSGSGKREVDAAMADVTREVGREGVRLIRRRLDSVLVNPTGHYRSKIDYTIRADERVELHDSGVVYGPWLEHGGAGTRFRGYATFRRTTRDIEQAAGPIGERELQRRLP